jgi:hypothetical protein
MDPGETAPRPQPPPNSVRQHLALPPLRSKEGVVIIPSRVLGQGAGCTAGRSLNNNLIARAYISCQKVFSPNTYAECRSNKAVHVSVGGGAAMDQQARTAGLHSLGQEGRLDLPVLARVAIRLNLTYMSFDL